MWSVPRICPRMTKRGPPEVSLFMVSFWCGGTHLRSWKRTPVSLWVPITRNCSLSHRRQCRGQDGHPSRHTLASCDSYRLHPRRVAWLPVSDIDDAVHNGVGRLPFSCHSSTLARRRTTSALNAYCRVVVWLYMQVLLQTCLVTGEKGEGYGAGIATVTITAFNPTSWFEFMTKKFPVRFQANRACDASSPWCTPSRAARWSLTAVCGFLGWRIVEGPGFPGWMHPTLGDDMSHDYEECEHFSSAGNDSMTLLVEHRHPTARMWYRSPHACGACVLATCDWRTAGS